MSIEDDAIWLSKAVMKLDEHGFIQTSNEEEELHCENLRGGAVYYARKIRDWARQRGIEQAGESQ